MNAIKHCVYYDARWTATSEFVTYRLCEQRRFRRACASAQSRQNLRCSLIQAVSQKEPSDRKPDPWPLWMAGHAQLKFVMTECSKTQIRLTGPRWFRRPVVWHYLFSIEKVLFNFCGIWYNMKRFCVSPPGPIPAQFSLPIYCSLINHYIPGAFYPLGGPSEIPFHMIPIVQSHGGQVLVDARVTQILINVHGNASGKIILPCDKSNHTNTTKLNPYELPHDKTNRMTVRPVKTLSLGTRPVWSESSLCGQWVAKYPIFL